MKPTTNFSEEIPTTDSTEQTTITVEEIICDYVAYWTSNVHQIEDDDRRDHFTRLMADVLAHLYGWEAGVQFLFDILEEVFVPITGETAPDH